MKITTQKYPKVHMDKDCGDSGHLAIYDHTGKKIALVFDAERGSLLVDCYNLSSFLFTNREGIKQ